MHFLKFGRKSPWIWFYEFLWYDVALWSMLCFRITAKIDDDMIRYYVDEDLFLLEVSHSRTSPEQNVVDRNTSNPGSPGDPDDPNENMTIGFDVTLIELPSAQPQLPPSPIAVTHSHSHGHTHVHGHSQHVHEVANTWTLRRLFSGREWPNALETARSSLYFIFL